MKVNCPDCQKAFDIPDEKLQKYGKQIKFSCPACQKGLIEIHLSTKASQPDAPQSVKTTRRNPPGKSAAEVDRPASGTALKNKILRKLEDLPPMPQIVLRAREVMANPNAGINDLVKLLQNDQSIVTKVLRLGNSAYYGLSGKISTVKHAAVLLGQKTLNEVITMAGISNLMGKKLEGYGLDSGDLWRHSLAVGFGSRFLADKINPQLSNDVFVAGLIHDAGKIILDEYALQRQDEFDTFMADGEQNFLDAEKELLGIDHSEIASEICKKWIIPEPIRHAIRWHHRPSRANGDQMALFIHVADYFAKMSGMGTGIDDLNYQLEENSMDALGFQEEELDFMLVEVMESVEKIAEEFPDI